MIFQLVPKLHLGTRISPKLSFVRLCTTEMELRQEGIPK